MCGRYTHEHSWPEVHAYLSAMTWAPSDGGEPVWEARYNVSPSQKSTIVRGRADGLLELVPMRWGLRPGWAKDGKLAPINARGETVRTGPMFRAAFKGRRCLLPVSGFYEWEKFGDKSRKQPWYFHSVQGRVLTFGALWEPGNEHTEGVDTFTIVTTAANELIAPLHDRMPLIVPPEAARTWVFGTPDEAAALIVPAPATLMSKHRVRDLVNKPQNQGSELIASID